MIHLLPAKAADAFALTLREEDAREVTPGWRERIAELIGTSKGVFAGWDLEGNLLGLGGAIASDEEVVPWLLCSPLVDQHRASIFRIARRAVAQLRLAPQRVGNLIPNDSPRNRAFVERLGFRITPTNDAGIDYFYLPHV